MFIYICHIHMKFFAGNDRYLILAAEVVARAPHKSYFRKLEHMNQPTMKLIESLQKSQSKKKEKPTKRPSEPPKSETRVCKS